MVNPRSLQPSYLTSFGIPLLLVLLLAGLAYSPFFALHPAPLSLGITLDLVLTVPLVYFLLIRNRAIPVTTVVLWFVLGTVVASLVLPEPHHTYLNYVKTWGVPFVEVIILTTLSFKVHRAVLHYRRERKATPDFHSAAREATASVLPPPVASLLATEISVIYYGFISWRKRKPSVYEFSYHRHSGSIALLATAIFLTLAETFVVHLLLARWSVTAAWILTAISAYTAVQLFGILRSMVRRPIVLDGETLKIRYGLLGETTLSQANITTVELISQTDALPPATHKLSPLGELEPHNVIIHLARETTVRYLYGSRRSCTALALFVDEPERFAKTLRAGQDER